MFDTSLVDNFEFLSASKAVHLWNEMFRRDRNFDRDSQFAAHSCFERLWTRYFKNDN
jgi:hypothetical protein